VFDFFLRTRGFLIRHCRPIRLRTKLQILTNCYKRSFFSKFLIAARVFALISKLFFDCAFEFFLVHRPFELDTSNFVFFGAKNGFFDLKLSLLPFQNFLDEAV